MDKCIYLLSSTINGKKVSKVFIPPRLSKLDGDPVCSLRQTQKKCVLSAHLEIFVGVILVLLSGTRTRTLVPTAVVGRRSDQEEVNTRFF